jgi:sulfatase modifying factor 1
MDAMEKNMQTCPMERSCLLSLAIALPLLLVSNFLVSSASATVNFDWVTVGDSGNPADTLVMTKGVTADLTTGYGSVGYSYQIADKHVTNTQYTEFLNAVDPDGSEPHPILGNRNGIYNPNMSLSTIGFTGTAYTGGINFNGANPAGSKYSVKSGQDGQENYPATWINWDSGARFVNWLHNGQGSGNTENGVYDMSIPRSTIAGPLPRQAGATVFIPSEDEFYKAAYYDPTKGGTGGYWEYGIQSNTAPVSGAPSGGATTANYATAAGAAGSIGDTYWQNSGGLFDDSLDHLTDVGAYSSATSYYGLYDVDGLIYQWTEGVKVHSLGADFPAYRGGGWHDSSERNGAAFRALYSFRDVAAYAWFGLRIASPVPLTADFDGDGDVDGDDLTDPIDGWEARFGDDLDGLNFMDWQREFGTNVPPLLSAAQAVPEPSSLVLLTLAAAGVLYRQRRCAV